MKEGEEQESDIQQIFRDERLNTGIEAVSRDHGSCHIHKIIRRNIVCNYSVGLVRSGMFSADRSLEHNMNALLMSLVKCNYFWV